MDWEKKDEMAYIVAGIIEWPSLYNDEKYREIRVYGI